MLNIKSFRRKLGAALGMVLVGGMLSGGVFLGTARAENWPQWRGAKGDGVSTEKNIPLTWSQTENIAWRVPLPGMGGSTPAVWGDKIFLTSAKDQDLLLICVGDSGKILWERKVDSGDHVVRSDEGNMASPSPCVDGEHVWVMMGTGALACYDFAGKEVWKVDLEERYGKFNIQFGMASTPVLDKDRLYLQLMHTDAALVLALEKASGKEVWRHQRQSDARDECLHSYASPVLYRDGEREYLLSHGADYIIAHNLKDGSELWRCGGLNPLGKYNPTLRFVASPLAVPGLIVVPSAKNGPVLGLRPDGKGNLTENTTSYYWTRKENTPDVPSPLMVDGLVYLCTESGILICMDAKTGEEFYKERTHNHRHRASPIYADGKIFLTSRDGIVNVIQPGREFKILATNDLGEEISASPAIANKTLYLRSFNALYAIRAK